MFSFLRSIGLYPLEWSQAIQATGKSLPYIGEILDSAFSKAQAIIILLTGDDEAILLERFRRPSDPPFESQLTPQARPNVIFEAGMAMGRDPNRTILVQLGDLRPFSDVSGLHIIHLSNSTEKRQEFAQRLELAECQVDLSGTDWHTEGNFEITTTIVPHTEDPIDFSQPEEEIDSMSSLESFWASKGSPDSFMDLTLLFGYWLYHKEDIDPFNSEDIAYLYDLLRIPVSSNIPYNLSYQVSRKNLLAIKERKDGRNTYRISRQGEEYVIKLAQ